MLLRKYYSNGEVAATCELKAPTRQNIGDNEEKAWGVELVFSEKNSEQEKQIIYGEDAIQAMELAIQFLHTGIEKAKGLAWLKNE